MTDFMESEVDKTPFLELVFKHVPELGNVGAGHEGSYSELLTLV